jgi:lysophospholipase L1-like esterase
MTEATPHPWETVYSIRTVRWRDELATRGWSLGRAALAGVLLVTVIIAACGLVALAGSSTGNSAEAARPVPGQPPVRSAGIVASLTGPFARLLQSKPAEPPRKPPKKPVARKPAVKVVRIMPLGDSITKGYGDGYSSAWSVGYRADLYRRVTAAGMKVDFVGSQRNGSPDPDHEGHSGWQIAQLSRNASRWVKAYKPDVVLLMAGTNDINHETDLAHAPARLGLLIDRILAARPGVRVMVATVPARRPPSKRAAQTAAYNRGVIAQVAARWRAGKPVTLVPMHVLSPVAGDYRDAVHLNHCGYLKVSFVWYLYLRRSAVNTTRSVWPIGADPLRHPTCRPPTR